MLKARQRLGKYQIEAPLGEGGFATVYRALDTIEGIKVALKVPHPELSSKKFYDEFLREVRLSAGLDHPGILPIKNASIIDDRFVVAYPLGQATLGDRLQRRVAPKTALSYAEQILEAVAYAHRHKVVHCDLKPDNFIMFPGNRVRLTDFGIAKLALRRATLSGSGTGSVGFLAPEQAFGRPTYASDVFALGLLCYRLFAGQLPTWPYEWPPPGYDRLKRAVHPDLIAIIYRATDLDHKKRYQDANRMLAAFRRVEPRALRGLGTKRRRRGSVPKPVGHWRTLRLKEFNLGLGRALQAKHQCGRCRGPMSESMRSCPWCGNERKRHTGRSPFPARCPRCRRGVKLDWRFCPWCYGGVIQEPSAREYTDVRYEGKCRSTRCSRKDLMPFMRYCPWCRTKVARKWKLPQGGTPCTKCGWGVAADYWSACPWCGTGMRST
jgi:serine/threonine-protein kinase